LDNQAAAVFSGTSIVVPTHCTLVQCFIHSMSCSVVTNKRAMLYTSMLTVDVASVADDKE